MTTPHGYRNVLATDLDGTLIPFANQTQQQAALQWLHENHHAHSIGLVFVTGRNFHSVQEAITQFQLPIPDWIICNVGASIYQRTASGEFQVSRAYETTLDQIVSHLPISNLAAGFSSHPAMRLQREGNQTRHKLSYIAAADLLPALEIELQNHLQALAAPYSLITSVDPFDGDGMIDFLPQNVSKAFALDWWTQTNNVSPAQIVFAGDSGNDLAALIAGYRTILVGNADLTLAKKVHAAHRNYSGGAKFFAARQHATAGVLEGCRWFGLFPDDSLLDWHKLSFGANPISADSVAFKVWAPKHTQVEVEINDGSRVRRYALAEIPADPPDERSSTDRSGSGVFVAVIGGVSIGSLYMLRLGGQNTRPDPCSHFQPRGVHGPSQVIDHCSYPWTDAAWEGVAKKDCVIYEAHVGTMTAAGTYLALIDELDRLKQLGITAIELMPLAETPGRWNWGYDGVHLYAPKAAYGTPDDLKQLVDACHEKGLAIFLDVVYNHLGPEGNYLREFGPYFSAGHQTPWGDAFNFDAKDSHHVRNYIIQNAIYWLKEYHFDGLRLDAIHFMFDDSELPITVEIARAINAFQSTCQRKIHLIAESNIYDQSLLAHSTGDVYSAIWSDCLMHSIYSHAVPDVRLTPRKYTGAADIADALTHGYIFTAPQAVRAVRPAAAVSLPQPSERPYLESLIMALQTHDSVGNHPQGKRIHHLVDREFQMAAAPLFLLYPAIPMIFMGEERAAESAFRFFADFEDQGLRRAVDQGRQSEYPQHQWEGAIPPSDPQAFLNSKLSTWEQSDAAVVQWYQSLLAFRRAGIADAWLSAKRLTTSYQVANHVFRLQYLHHDHAIVICSQLLPKACPPSELIDPKIDIGNRGKPLFDSWENTASDPEKGNSRCWIYRSPLSPARSE